MTLVCPKAMVHGPCGGVRADGSCEVAPEPCAFLALPLQLAERPDTAAGAPTTAAAELLALARRRPLVVADLPAPALDADGLRACATAVAGGVDAALLGDAPWARVQLPPVARATVVREEGVRAWSALTCRDRNRVALESELAGLAWAGAAAVHCVTGDHPASGHRPDAAAVFDLDSTRLAGLAATRGLVVSVAESPGAPPRERRAARANEKIRAGARVVFVADDRGPAAVGEFIAATRALGAGEALFVACVPFAAGEDDARRLERFGTGRVTAGIAAAASAGARMLATEGVDGVDLSTAAAPGAELATATAVAAVAAELGGGS